ncbi:tripartite tricarboxylate transporter substrate binding protein [Bordetella genomosp. 8]|nr:tripartite tricarboxylate transporter substrate binding protein [Bordetella genomosp. 8]
MRNAPGIPWPRRVGSALAIAVCLFTNGPATAAAESATDYPSRPIHLISGFEPGGATDVVARLVGRQLSRVLGTSVVIDNKPGASGNIGAGYVARSDPDGYTLYLANATVAMPSLFRTLPFDIRKDFAPLSLIGYGPSVLIANPKAPVKSVKELIEYARQHEGKVDYGSGGVGNITHMAMELFISMTGVKLIHIPYKGGAPATTAVMAGEVPVAFSAISDVIGHARDGSVVPLAISSRERSPALPDVPTVAEAGVPGYEASSWYGIVAPAGTPKSIQDKLTKALVACLQDKVLLNELVALGIEPADAGGAQEFRKYIDSEIDKWAKVIAQGHIVAR